MYEKFKDIHHRTCLTTSKINLHKFCMAMPSNLVFSRGFELDRPILSDNRYCYYPCNGKMSEWQKNSSQIYTVAQMKRKFTPVGLLNLLLSYDDVSYSHKVLF